MLMPYIPREELRAHFAGILVPAGEEFWARRVSVDEDLLTWWAAMGPMLSALTDRRQSLSTPFVVRHFRNVGEVLRRAGATSGAELLDGPTPTPRKKGYGIWHHFRDL